MLFVHVVAALISASPIDPPTLESMSQQVAEVVSDVQLEKELFVLGDIDGDARPDAAAMATIKDGLEALAKKHVTPIDVDPYSKNNGKALAGAPPPHCLSMWVSLSSRPGGQALFLLVPECASSIQVAPKKLSPRGTKAKGVLLKLETEAGGQSAVIWDGRGFRGVALRSGD